MAIADKTLYLVRHGTTAANFADILQGRADNPLSEEGLAEAARL
ncbi:MAG TPA: phosphoglycerate mutase family protein, partial [Candidatus Aminicenantes bacterium]|nr:phosphoglycerate mutase family protein [Candidatus Aminicenantes bacterium]